MKKLMVVVATLLSMTAHAAAPSVSPPLPVTTTSAAYFVPLGYIGLTCTSPVYYAVEASSSGTALTTDALHPGPKVVNNVALAQTTWINITSNQWLALLLKSGVQGFCIVEQPSVDGVSGSFTTLAASGATTLSSTLAVTGASTLTGNVSAGGTLAVTGATTLGSTLAVTGASTLTGNVSAGGTLAVTGTSTLTGNVTMSGAATVGTTLGVTGATTLSSTLGVTGASTLGTGSTALAGLTFGSCTLNAASPSTCTGTVLSGMKCQCTPEAAADGLTGCAVSSTTLTATGPNGSTGVINYLCVK